MEKNEGILPEAMLQLYSSLMRSALNCRVDYHDLRTAEVQFLKDILQLQDDCASTSSAVADMSTVED